MIYKILDAMKPVPIIQKPFPEILRPFLDCDVQKINLDIELELDRYREISDRYYAKYNGWRKGVVGKNNYLGLGLQYNDEKNPIFDCVPTIGSKRAIEEGILTTSFCKLNEIGLEFEPLIKAFDKIGIPLIRGRLLKSLPGQAANQHYDLDYRIHIPLTTNPQAKAIFGQQKFHMSAGNIYLHNGFRRHSFENLGSEPRVHLVFVVAGLTYDSGLNALAPGFEGVIDPFERQKYPESLSQV